MHYRAGGASYDGTDQAKFSSTPLTTPRAALPYKEWLHGPTEMGGIMATKFLNLLFFISLGLPAPACLAAKAESLCPLKKSCAGLVRQQAEHKSVEFVQPVSVPGRLLLQMPATPAGSNDPLPGQESGSRLTWSGVSPPC